MAGDARLDRIEREHAKLKDEMVALREEVRLLRGLLAPLTPRAGEADGRRAP